MSDGGKIIEGESPNSPSNPQTKVDSVSETITVPFSADISPSRHAKILRQLANILHALLANSMRYAAISDGANNCGSKDARALVSDRIQGVESCLAPRRDELAEKAPTVR